MTTALAFDLFLVEDEMIKENELVSIINKGSVRRNNLLANLSLVKNDNPEIKSLFSKAHNSENKIAESKGSFFENQNLDLQSFTFQFNNPENEILDSEKVRKDMIKGYMKLLS